MAKRTIRDIPTPHLTVEQANEMVGNFMRIEGFRVIQYRGETVLKCGYGIWVAPQYMKLEVYPGMVHMEAWIRAFGEQDLEGFMGAIPKAMLQAKVDKFTRALLPPQGMQPPQQAL